MFLGCFFYCFLKKFSFIEVELIYSVMLISVLLFPILLERPECPTRRPGCRLWVPCWPCLAAPEAASLQEAWKGLRSCPVGGGVAVQLTVAVLPSVSSAGGRAESVWAGPTLPVLWVPGGPWGGCSVTGVTA